MTAANAEPVRRTAWCRLRAFTLVELLIVVSLMGIFAATVITRWQPNLHDQLMAAGQVISSDLAYSRSLAIAYNSRYRISFDTDGERYVLRHSGTSAALDKLPESPYRSSTDSQEEQTTDLSELPTVFGSVQLLIVLDSNDAPVTNVEFQPLGGTTRSESTSIWLSAGTGSAMRFLPVSIDPVTGMAEIGEMRARSPVAASEADSELPVEIPSRAAVQP